MVVVGVDVTMGSISLTLQWPLFSGLLFSQVEFPFVNPALDEVDLVMRPASGISGDLGGWELIFELNGLVDLDLWTLEALEEDPLLFPVPVPVLLLIDSKSSLLPIFSNMALALLNRAWWLSVLATEDAELTEFFFTATAETAESLVVGLIKTQSEVFFKRMAAIAVFAGGGEDSEELFWNLLAICETRPPSFLARGLEGPKTPPRPPVEEGGASLTVDDSLCFILF
jgi:hypothetical protein